MISFTVPGNPVAQPRAKAAKRGKFIHIYTPDKKVKPYKDAVKLVASQEMAGMNPLNGPLEVAIVFYIERPKSHTKKQRECGWHAQKPDIDNLAKAAIDALKDIAWTDDSQIAELRLRKHWATAERGYTFIKIQELTHG